MSTLAQLVLAQRKSTPSFIASNNLPYNNQIIDGAYGNGRWVMIENFYTWTSTNGMDWTRGTVPSISSGQLRKIVFDGAQFVITVYGTYNIYISADGQNWSLYTDTEVGIYAIGLAYGNGKYIATSNSRTTIGISSDAISWTSPATFGFNPFQPVYGNGKWVVAGTTGAKTSTDNGVTWSATTAISGVNSSLQYSTFGNNKYVCTSSQEVISSTDGVTWSVVGSPSSGSTIADVSSGPEGFLLSSGTGGSGGLYRSTNATSWTRLPYTLTQVLGGITYNPDLGVYAVAARSSNKIYLLTL